MGSRVPPAVTACPAPDCSWSRVALTITVTGSPWCWPSVGSPSWPRTSADRASCWRWACPRESRSAAASVGSPSVTGTWSAGLHMPGAANLANQASSMARSSGVAVSFPTLVPSARCPHQRKPRCRARSSSENLPSGFSVSASRAASFSNWSGRNSAALAARNSSAAARAGAGMSPGRSRMND